MTSYELARQLLAGSDLPVALMMNCDDDSVSGIRKLAVRPGSYTKDRIYVSRDGEWRDNQNLEPTFIFVEAKADQEFQVEVFEDEA